jgi:hypothetical protein
MAGSSVSKTILSAALLVGATLLSPAALASPTPIPATYYLSDDPGLPPAPFGSPGSTFVITPNPGPAPGITISNQPLDPATLPSIVGTGGLSFVEPDGSLSNFRTFGAGAAVTHAGAAPAVSAGGAINQAPLALPLGYDLSGGAPTTYTHSHALLLYSIVITPIGGASSSISIPVTVHAKGNASAGAPATDHAHATAIMMMPQFTSASPASGLSSYAFDSSVDFATVSAMAAAGSPIPANALALFAEADSNAGVGLPPSASFDDAFTLDVPVSTVLGIGLFAEGEAQMTTGPDSTNTLPAESLSYSAFADPEFTIDPAFLADYQIIASDNLFAAPEPATLMLLGGALVAFGALRRRARRTRDKMRE